MKPLKSRPPRLPPFARRDRRVVGKLIRAYLARVGLRTKSLHGEELHLLEKLVAELARARNPPRPRSTAASARSRATTRARARSAG